MGPMGNQLQFLLASPAHSLLLSVFLNLSSSTLAKSTSLIPSIHFYPSSSSLPHLYFLFLPHQSTLYSPQSPPPLSKAIPDVAVRAPIAFSHFFQPLLQEVGPFGKRKEERSKRVIGFRGALREGRPKSTTRTLTSHTTCVHGFKRRRALMHPHTDNIFMLLSSAGMFQFSFFLWKCLYLNPCCSYYQPFWKPPSQRLERGSWPRKRDEGEGLLFRRNVLELESE